MPYLVTLDAGWYIVGVHYGHCNIFTAQAYYVKPDPVQSAAWPHLKPHSGEPLRYRFIVVWDPA